jgi:two-component system response regulator AdeR
MDIMTAPEVKGRILVVDDEPKVVAIVKSYLTREGFQVSEARDGREALAAFRESPPDLIVLDIMLPQINGLAVLHEVRHASKVPVILLTARSEDEDKLAGLELGADDYVTKPFSPRELVARIKAVLRRSQGETEKPNARVRLGELVLDQERHEVSCHGKAVSLTPTEFRLLTALAASPGRVLSREQLLDRGLGQESEAYDRTVDAHIKNLRHKMGQGASCRITTVQGVGYKLEDNHA